MTLLTYSKDQTRTGAYGVVFFTSDGDAVKLFLRRNDASEEHVENVYQSEVSAYELAMAHPILKFLVPHFYGSLSVNRVMTVEGNDISHRFYLSKAYRMKKVEGEFKKLSELPSEISEKTMTDFKLAGIHHICDASATMNNQALGTVIDFATREFILEHVPVID